MASSQPTGETVANQSQPNNEPTQALRNNTIHTRPAGPLIRQSRPGRAAGSQGYSASDMTALTECVLALLPLGTTEWNEVCDRYNSYAHNAGRALRASHSLKTKFRTLVHHPNPSGLLDDCPSYVRLAKQAAKAIEKRSRFLISQDPDWAESDEDKGTGTSVQVSGRSTTMEDDQERATQENGEETRPLNPQTQVEPSGNPAGIPVLPAQVSEEGSQSSASPVMISTTSLQPFVRSTTSPLRTASQPALKSLQRPGPTKAHPLRSNYFSPMGSRDRRDLSAIGGSGRRDRGSTDGDSKTTRGNNLQPEPGSSSQLRERENDRGLVDFYSLRLQEANATIIRLQDEASRSKDAHASRVQALEDENRRLRDSLLQQTVKADSLQGQLEMMGRLWDLSKASSFAFFQPSTNQTPLNIPSFPNFNLPQSTSSSIPHMPPVPPVPPPTSDTIHNQNSQPSSMPLGASSSSAEHLAPSVSTSTALDEQNQVGSSAPF
ncbi:hypothetical protein PGT21_011284 [Puccinia graminis f. sp. tritici]|nr:hypothetical protein PGT21_011284 [Puccinia graminis f. sp. tritici]